MLSIIIPARNERYLKQTIKDLLIKSVENIEVIAILDGYWPKYDELVLDERVNYIHYSKARGMRNAITMGVNMAKYPIIMKTDAHCMFISGYDKHITETHKQNRITVPRRKRLNPDKWELIEDGRPPVDYEYIDSKDLHGVRWDEKGEERKHIMVDKIISAQGSCYVMTKELFNKLGLDENKYGKFYLEFQELSFKAWTQGYEVVVDKNIWYAHWHKTEGRGYSLSDDREKSVKALSEYRENPKFKEIINSFKPMPTW
jgi:glycosyltransferase involved in cell wall biosynthesis